MDLRDEGYRNLAGVWDFPATESTQRVLLKEGRESETEQDEEIEIGDFGVSLLLRSERLSRASV